MKTEIMIYPGNDTANLKFGDHEIEMSYTFIHFLNGVLSMGRKPTAEAYPNDLDSFQQALQAMEEEMLRSSRAQTKEEKALCLERYHKWGTGYHSTWMNERRIGYAKF